MAQNIVGESTYISGSVYGEDDLIVHGQIDGEIELLKTLFIEHSGVIKADIKAKNIIIRGIAVGNIESEERIEITETGVVKGDLIAPRVVIREDAKFSGNIIMDSYDSISENLDVERLEAEKLKAEKLKAEKLKAEKLKDEKLKAEKLKAEKLKAEKLKAEKLKAEKLKAEKLKAEKLKAEKLKAEKLKAEKLKAEKLKAEKLKEEKLKAEKLKEEKLKAEKLKEEKLKEEKLKEEKLKEEKLDKSAKVEPKDIVNNKNYLSFRLNLVTKVEHPEEWGIHLWIKDKEGKTLNITPWSYPVKFSRVGKGGNYIDFKFFIDKDLYDIHFLIYNKNEKTDDFKLENIDQKDQFWFDLESETLK